MNGIISRCVFFLGLAVVVTTHADNVRYRIRKRRPAPVPLGEAKSSEAITRMHKITLYSVSISIYGDYPAVRLSSCVSPHS